MLPPDAVAAALQMSPQHAELLLATLAAAGPGGSGGAVAGGAPGAVSMHQLLLFLLAQMYGRDAHKPETQDHWPDANEARAARAASPGVCACILHVNVHACCNRPLLCTAFAPMAMSTCTGRLITAG